MNKCIVFFIVLVLVLVVAVITDNGRSSAQESNLVDHAAEAHRTIVNNKAKVDIVEY